MREKEPGQRSKGYSDAEEAIGPIDRGSLDTTASNDSPFGYPPHQEFSELRIPTPLEIDEEVARQEERDLEAFLEAEGKRAKRNAQRRVNRNKIKKKRNT
jgi:hypothetical protein